MISPSLVIAQDCVAHGIVPGQLNLQCRDNRVAKLIKIVRDKNPLIFAGQLVGNARRAGKSGNQSTRLWIGVQKEPG